MTLSRILLSLTACLVVTAGAMVPELGAASDDRDRDASRHDRDDDRERGRDRGDDGDDDDRSPPARTLSLDEAMAQAEKRYRARAVHGEEKRKGDRIVYRIRLLDQDGRVFEVSIDAGSGRDR